MLVFSYVPDLSSKKSAQGITNKQPKSAPGTNSSYALPTPPLGTVADAGNQHRGGPGGIVTPTSTFI